jgi:MerR family transcriptional regulator, light-induced transcriptional regulator
MGAQMNRMSDTQPQYPIGTVARRTGLSTHVLRAWERRYGVVTPTRSPGGTRLYSNADILRLRLLRRVTEGGYGISHAAKLSTDELLGLVQEEAEEANEAEPSAERLVDADSYVVPALRAIEAMDGPRIHASLMRAAVSLGARDFMTLVAIPLLHRIGDLWVDGLLCPAHEHLFSVQLRRVLAWLLESLPVPSNAPGLVATTPSGQWHEMGAMLASVVSAGEGWRVTYLGPDLPARDIATAAEVTRASVVLLSVVGGMDEGVLLPQVADLREALPEEILVLVGGRGAEAHGEALAAAGATWLPSLDGLSSMLRTLASTVPAVQHPDEDEGDFE